METPNQIMARVDGVQISEMPNVLGQQPRKLKRPKRGSRGNFVLSWKRGLVMTAEKKTSMPGLRDLWNDMLDEAATVPAKDIAQSIKKAGYQ